MLEAVWSLLKGLEPHSSVIKVTRRPRGHNKLHHEVENLFFQNTRQVQWVHSLCSLEFRNVTKFPFFKRIFIRNDFLIIRVTVQCQGHATSWDSRTHLLSNKVLILGTMFYLIMSLFWKMIYHHSVLRDICNDFLFDFGQIVRYLKPKPNLQSNYELTKVKKYTGVVFLRILEQIWNPFSFKSFSLFHTRLSLEAFVLYNYVTVVCELGHIGY